MWYHIKARHEDISKPYGEIIIFWLFVDDKNHINQILKKQHIKNIEWVREEIPPFAITNKQQ
jgi:hypothetical protein